MSKELFRQSSWYFIGYGSGVILSLVGFPLWTRYFSVQEYGMLSLIAATISFVGPISRLGLSKAVLRFFSEFRSGKRDIPQSSFYTTFFIGSLASGACVGVLFLGAILVLGPEGLGGRETQVLFILAGMSILIGPSSTIYAPFLRVEEKPKQFVSIRIFRTFLQFGLSVILVFVFVLGLRGIYIAALTVNILMLLFVVFMLRRQNKLKLSAFSPGLLFDALRFGVPLIAAQLANHISNIGDRFVIQFLLGTEAVAVYAVGYGLTSHLKSVLTVIMFVVTPMYVSTWEKHGRGKTEEFLSSVLDYYLMAAIPGMILLSVFGCEIIVLLASAKYESAGVLIPYLATPLVLHGAIAIYTAGIFIHKKTHLILYFTVSAGIINIILNFVLIPAMGIVGAAVATLISYLFLIVLANILSSKFLTIRLNYRGIFNYIVASMVAVLLVRFVNIDMVFGILLKVTIAVLIYSGVMITIDHRIRCKVQMVFK